MGRFGADGGGLNRKAVRKSYLQFSLVETCNRHGGTARAVDAKVEVSVPDSGTGRSIDSRSGRMP